MSGANAYPIPPMCAAHPFFMGAQLPNTVTSQSMCNAAAAAAAAALQVPWPCVNPRLPNQPIPAASQIQANANPMMTFATAGHNNTMTRTVGQLSVAPHPNRMMSGSHRLQVIR